MCGIYGYVSQSPRPLIQAPQIVLEGLKTLEYRGYDSWGIASLKNNSIAVTKAVGRVSDHKLQNDFGSSIGIGHTRWATHGGVTYDNSHPHVDCHGNFAIVHNGIVENFLKLKRDLEEKGHIFQSETDSEVIAHLLEDYSDGRSLVEAIRIVFPLLHGKNAVVALDKGKKEIAAVKNGSPLVVGIGEGEYYISSDQVSIAPHTLDIVNVCDNHIVTLNSTIHLYDLVSGVELTPTIEQINPETLDVSLGDYEYYMLKEIHEQPRVIQSIANSMVEEVENAVDVVNSASNLFMTGCGTAYNAALGASYLFSEIANQLIHVAPASEFSRLEPFITPDSALIALTQSGETIDVVEPVQRAKAKGTKVLALVNVRGSTVQRQSDVSLLLNAGFEKAVASTKAYTAKLSLLSLMAYAAAGKIAEGQQALYESVQEIERLLTPESQATLQEIAASLVNEQSLYIIGRGISYPAALEGALKIKEVSYLHTEGFAGGELKHGTIALITKGTPCIVLAPEDEHYASIISNAIEIKSRGGRMIGISPTHSPVFDEWIEVRHTGLSVLTQSIPLQLLAYYLATEKGLDPDMPRNLAKSVTVR